MNTAKQFLFTFKEELLSMEVDVVELLGLFQTELIVVQGWARTLWEKPTLGTQLNTFLMIDEKIETIENWMKNSLNFPKLKNLDLKLDSFGILLNENKRKSAKEDLQWQVVNQISQRFLFNHKEITKKLIETKEAKDFKDINGKKALAESVIDQFIANELLKLNLEF